MTFPGYPSYKNCEDKWINAIPHHWETRPIKSIADIDNSGYYGEEPDELASNFPVATTAQIDKNGSFSIEDMPVRSFNEEKSSRYLCKEGDILIVKSSGSATNIISGKAGIVRAEDKGFIFSNFLMRIKSDGKKILPTFLYYFIRSDITKQRVNLMCSSTTYPNLRVGEYISAHVTLPPISEQTTIATFLDHEITKIDALIADQERLIELLQEKRQAVISHAVTKGLNPEAPMKDSGVEWLGDVPEHWKTGKIKHYFRTASGSTPNSEAQSLYYTDEEDERGTPWIRTTDIDNGEVTNAEIFITEQAIADTACKPLPIDTVLVALYGGSGTVGKNGILKITASVNQALCAILPAQECIPEYLHKYVQFLRPFWMERAVSARKAGNISQELVGDTPFPLPPINEQQDILNFLNQSISKIVSLSCAADSCLQLLKERRSSLISAAVTGQIDVGGLVPKEEAI